MKQLFNPFCCCGNGGGSGGCVHPSSCEILYLGPVVEDVDDLDFSCATHWGRAGNSFNELHNIRYDGLATYANFLSDIDVDADWVIVVHIHDSDYSCLPFCESAFVTAIPETDYPWVYYRYGYAKEEEIHDLISQGSSSWPNSSWPHSGYVRFLADGALAQGSVRPSFPADTLMSSIARCASTLLFINGLTFYVYVKAIVPYTNFSGLQFEGTSEHRYDSAGTEWHNILDTVRVTYTTTNTFALATDIPGTVLQTLNGRYSYEPSEITLWPSIRYGNQGDILWTNIYGAIHCTLQQTGKYTYALIPETIPSAVYNYDKTYLFWWPVPNDGTSWSAVPDSARKEYSRTHATFQERTDGLRQYYEQAMNRCSGEWNYESAGEFLPEPFNEIYLDRSDQPIVESLQIETIVENLYPDE